MCHPKKNTAHAGAEAQVRHEEFSHRLAQPDIAAVIMAARILQSVNILLPRPATIQHVIAKLNLDLNGFPIDKLKHEKH